MFQSPKLGLKIYLGINLAINKWIGYHMKLNIF